MEAVSDSMTIAGRRMAETILVVDDDEDVRGVLASLLEELGYGVVTAADGTSALEAARQKTPDLAVIDFSMPGMSGARLAVELQGSLADLPIVFTSGHADTTTLALRSAPLLKKPFRLHELATIVRGTLDARRG
jgi:CheY-like chemotaxis protein